MKAANKRRRRRPTDYSIAKYKEYRNKLTNLKRKLESDRWQKFVESIQDPKDLSKFAKSRNPMTKLKGLKRGDTMLTEDCDVADMLREAHFPGSVVDPDPERVPELPESDRKCDVYGSIGAPRPGAPVDEADYIRKMDAKTRPFIDKFQKLTRFCINFLIDCIIFFDLTKIFRVTRWFRQKSADNFQK